jgi:hypothetical protein
VAAASEPIDPALYTPVVVDRRRYSGDWWKVQQEEARALREKKAREAAKRGLRRLQTGAAQDGGKEGALDALRPPNAIAVPEGPPLIVAKLGEQFCTDADGSTSAGHHRMGCASPSASGC